MKVTSATLRRIAAMPEQAMGAALLFLAEELEADEVRRAGAAQRQAEYAERKRSRQNDISTGVSLTSVSRQSDAEMTSEASRVDNLSSSTEFIETVSTPFNPPSKPKSPSEHPAFQSLWSIYPKRAGDRDRKGAVKAFGPALKRATSLEAILEGAARYAAFCEATGKLETEFVQQCRRWLNNTGWEKPWDIPRSTTNGSSIHDAWRIADAVLAEQDRREGLCGQGSEDDILALPEPEGRP